MENEPRRVAIGSEIFWEYKGKRYPDTCKNGNACSHIADTADRFCHGVGLDIGAGSYPFRDAFPVRDLTNHIYNAGKQTRRKIPLVPGIDANNLSCFVDNSLDYVFSSHCLEHLDDPWGALKLWVKKIKPGGIVFLYLPHPNMELWNPGAPWVKKAHKWMPTFDLVAGKFPQAGLKAIAGNQKCDAFYSFYVVGCKNG